jgi:hypothetical protein
MKEKGGNPDRKPCPIPYGLRNSYRNLKSENSQDYAQKPQQNCTFLNLASVVWNSSSFLAKLIISCEHFKIKSM